MKKFFLKFNKLITTILLIGIIIIAYFIFFNKNIQTASAGWWNDSWHYRKAIQITNNATAETNVYASTTIDTSDTTKFQTDCGDLRFTKYTGVELPYYIVSGCGTATTTIHINFETFEAGTQTIFYYYGNPTADNGFATSDFSTEASDYTIGTVGSEEIGGGPVGYWSFNEGYGATAHDESSGGNDGAITGAVWKDESECITGKCLYFDGDQDYVVASSTINPSLTDFTVSLWMKDNAVDSTADVIMDQMAGSGVSREFIQIRITNVISSYLGNASRDSTKTAVKSEWIHVELVHNNSANTLTWYINGNFSNTITSFTSNSADGDFVFGIDDALSAYDFHGYLDEIKTYNYARTADQVKQDYNAGLVGASAQSGTAVSFGSQSDKWLSDGLVGHWKMDEATTTGGAIDSSGNGNNGTYIDNASTTGAKFGKGGIFDGTGDSVAISGDVSNYLDMNQGSISLWYKANGANASDNLFSFAAGGDSLGLHFGESTTIALSYRPDYYGSYYTVSKTIPSVFTDTNWHHVVATWDVNGGNETLSIAVDGDRVTDNDPIVAPSAYSGTGYINGSSLNYFPGQIDEVRIYNRALNQDEVKKLYEYAPGPVLHLKMDEKVSGDAQTLSDISGNGNNGTTVDGANNMGMNCTVQGKYGSGCEFDGVDDYVNVGNPSNLNFGENESYTLEWWYRPNAVSYSIINKTGGGDARIHFFHSEGRLYRWSTFSGPTITTAEGWIHIAYVFSADGSNYGTETFFKNGIQSVTRTGNMPAWNTTQNWSIGGGISQWFMNTQVDDVRIYNYARTQKQILEDMAGTSAGASASRGGVNSPILDMDFDEGFGSTAHNKGIGGSSLNGTLTPGAGGTNTSTTQMWSLDGKNGKALEFDGTDDYVSVPDNDNLDFGTGDFSVYAWIKDNGVDRIINKFANATIDGWMLDVNDTVNGAAAPGHVRFRMADTSGHSVDYSVDGQVDDSAWHNIVVSIDRDSSQGLKFYVDGVQVGDSKDPSSVSGSVNNDQPLAIGVIPSVTGYYMNGKIDEVKIYNYALTEDDIKTVYNSGVSAVMGSSGTDSSTGEASNAASGEYCVPGDTSTCDAPVLHLKMDEKISGDAKTLYDISGNGNNGTTVDGANNTGMDCAVRGKYGSGCEFDGVDDYVSTSFGPNLGESSFTINLFTKFDSNSSSGRIFGGVADTGFADERIEIKLDNSSGYCGEIGDNYFLSWIEDTDSIGMDMLCSSRNYAADIWYDVSLVFDMVNSEIIFYVDGIKDNSMTITGNSNGSKNFTGYPLSIGTSMYKGIVDEVKFYNYARTPAQIAWDYNKGKPIAEWRFDECQGTVIHNDASTGAIFNGTLNQGATGITVPGTCKDGLSTSAWYLGSTGHQKASMYFDGLSDYVEILDNDLLDFTNSLTLSAWIKPTAAAQSLYSRIISKTPTGGGNELYALVTDNSPSNAPGIRITVGSTVNCFGNSIAPLNEWTHVLGTWNGTVSKLYFNGVLEKTCAIAGTLPSATSNLRIGDREDSPDDRRFKGMIDEVEIFNYVMTDEQIKNEFNSGAVRFGE